ncbi:MAG: glycosyltransferase [Pirellulales bacterium]|nr:glycosyltransferase [Pirellulales bacterium]
MNVKLRRGPRGLDVSQRRRRRAGEMTQLLRAGMSGEVGLVKRSQRVFLAGGAAAMLAPGGGETQMAATAQALQELGVAARLWRPWEDELAAGDVLHLFGSLPEHLVTVEQAQRRGVTTVLSTIAWFDVASRWHSGESLARRTWNCAKVAGRRALPWLSHWRRDLYEAVDLLLPNSQAEAAQLAEQYDVPEERIRIVPNGASPRFAAADAATFHELAQVRDFVLYAGRIEPRKNQLGFLRAMRGAAVPIVVLGDPVPGHERYFEACRRAAGNLVQFVPRLAHDDPRLAGAYAACRCLALTSWFETPGLVALEAGMSGVPLALTDRGPTREYFGELATYASPANRQSIRHAVLAAFDSPRNPQLARLVRERYTWRAAAAATRDAYRTLV